VFHRTSRKTSRRDVEAPETLESRCRWSFKISASVSEAATTRLGLGLKGLVHISARDTVYNVDGCLWSAS